MKKILRIGFLIILAVTLTACAGKGKAEQHTMEISRSQFSEETQEILDMLDNEIAFFDYHVDQSVKSMAINIWTYESGEWLDSGAVLGNLPSEEGRIAVRINDNSYDIFHIEEDGYTKSTHHHDSSLEDSNLLFVTHRLSDSAPIALNEEINLWYRLGTASNTFRTNSDASYNFREADCDSGLAVTITFSDQLVD